MHKNTTHNASSNTEDQSVHLTIARPDLGNPADPAAKEPQTSKESYADYIKQLPPPFWATKTARAEPASNEAIAARVNAVCAPVTAAQREEDKRLKAMSLRERWRYWKERREARERDKDPDPRPVERGSRAQLNVFGVNIREKGKR
ncbi:hypothetical protein BCR34DRAFT_565946 [Clohesyomyces aquaticus]|uniref:Uncharacterized protein n=1 Tax=Clohesyomyces aquaticus TaxID=1231657 RepID=A0A1Y1ZL03_9PLEO|nr:hypothetical protein BCR34DRAFT_565946 [Clohesyomyces aquaticus]